MALRAPVVSCRERGVGRSPLSRLALGALVLVVGLLAWWPSTAHAGFTARPKNPGGLPSTEAARRLSPYPFTAENSVMATRYANGQVHQASVVSPGRAGRMLDAFDRAGIRYDLSWGQGDTVQMIRYTTRGGRQRFVAVGPEGFSDSILARVKLLEYADQPQMLTFMQGRNAFGKAHDAMMSLAPMMGGAPMPTRRSAAAMAAFEEGGGRLYITSGEGGMESVGSASHTAAGNNVITLNLKQLEGYNTGAMPFMDRIIQQRLPQASSMLGDTLTPEHVFMHEATHYLDFMVNGRWRPDGLTDTQLLRALEYRSEVYANLADNGSYELAHYRSILRHFGLYTDYVKAANPHAFYGQNRALLEANGLWKEQNYQGFFNFTSH